MSTKCSFFYYKSLLDTILKITLIPVTFLIHIPEVCLWYKLPLQGLNDIWNVQTSTVVFQPTAASSWGILTEIFCLFSSLTWFSCICLEICGEKLSFGRVLTIREARVNNLWTIKKVAVQLVNSVSRRIIKCSKVKSAFFRAETAFDNPPPFFLFSFYLTRA